MLVATAARVSQLSLRGGSRGDCTAPGRMVVRGPGKAETGVCYATRAATQAAFHFLGLRVGGGCRRFGQTPRSGYTDPRRFATALCRSFCAASGARPSQVLGRSAGRPHIQCARTIGPPHPAPQTDLPRPLRSTVPVSLWAGRDINVPAFAACSSPLPRRSSQCWAHPCCAGVPASAINAPAFAACSSPCDAAGRPAPLRFAVPAALRTGRDVIVPALAWVVLAPPCDGPRRHLWRLHAPQGRGVTVLERTHGHACIHDHRERQAVSWPGRLAVRRPRSRQRVVSSVSVQWSPNRAVDCASVFPPSRTRRRPAAVSTT